MTTSGVYPAFYPSRRDDTTQAIKGPQSEGVYWPPSNAKINNVWNVTSTPTICLCGTLCLETRKTFTNRHIQFQCTVWILNCYSQSNTGWECGFANVRLNMMDMKGISSHKMHSIDNYALSQLVIDNASITFQPMQLCACLNPGTHCEQNGIWQH